MKNNFEESPDYQEYNHFLSKQLVKIHKEIGWSQKDVAEAMGITLRTEQNFEYCRRRLSAGVLGTFLKAADVSADYFFGWTNDIHSHWDPQRREEVEAIRKDLDTVKVKVEEYPKSIVKMQRELQKANMTLVNIQETYQKIEKRYQDLKKS